MANGRRGTVSAGERASLGETNYKRTLAYQRLGVRPSDVKPMAFFRSNLTRIARLMSRGRGRGEALDPALRPLEYLQYSEDPDARKVLAAYRSVRPSYRRLLSPETYCCLAGVAPERVLEIITTVAVSQTARMSAVLAAVWSPSLLRKTLEVALQSGEKGSAARLLILKAAGVVPSWGWKNEWGAESRE